MNRSTRIAALAVFGAALAFPALAQTVKVTPLGGIDGEFCPQDRALVFEDPNGTRVLYDPGRTVAGASDPRLGKIDIILVSHMHGDHVGNAHNKAPNSGSCDKPDMSVSAMPNSNAVEHRARQEIEDRDRQRDAAVLRGQAQGERRQSRRLDPRPLRRQRHRRRRAHRDGDGDAQQRPRSRLHRRRPRQGDEGGGHRRRRRPGRPATSLRFSNGLVAYLSGDTGITADQELVVRDHYHAKLAVMNIGDGFTTGPAEAAYVINELVKPASVIASHANEVGTVGGKVRPGSKTEAFIKARQGAGARPALGQDDGVRRRRASARPDAEPAAARLSASWRSCRARRGRASARPSRSTRGSRRPSRP